jgi:hypothetical protein
MHSFLEFGLNPLCVAVPEAFPHHLGQWDTLLSFVHRGTLLQNHVNGLAESLGLLVVSQKIKSL